MGPDNTYVGEVTITMDDMTITLERGSVITTLDEHNMFYEDEFYKMKVYSPTQAYSIAIKPQKSDRKRIVKLLMSRGIQRNGANELASYICKKYGRYDPVALLAMGIV